MKIQTDIGKFRYRSYPDYAIDSNWPMKPCRFGLIAPNEEARRKANAVQPPPDRPLANHMNQASP